MGEFDELIAAVKSQSADIGMLAAELREKKDRQIADELPNLDKQVSDAVAEMRAEFESEIKGYVDERVPAAIAPVGTTVPEPEFKSLGEWGVKSYAGELKKDFGDASGGVGGYTVPVQFIPELLELMQEDQIVRPRATIVEMTSDVVNVPAINPTSQATNFYGGMQGYWLAEAAQVTSSAWTAKQVVLTCNTLAGLGLVSEQLIADSPLNIQSTIERLFTNVIAFMEDEAYLTGNGATKPQGVLGSACQVAVTRTGATAFVFADAVKMYAAFLGRTKNAVWVINQSVIPQVLEWVANVGGGTSSPNIVVIDATQPFNYRILGAPVLISEKLPALGTEGDVMLCDFSKYLVGDRQVMAIDWSKEFKFDLIQQAVRGYIRVDGKPWMDTTYTPRKGTALSPFVVLN